MSLKPLKKSDLEKQWMKRRLPRDIPIQPEYHLIVTEGTKTEPNYFRAIRDHINQRYPGKIQLDIYGEGDNTVNLFDRACGYVKESPNVYKHIWVVYDIDDFPPDRINLTAELCEHASTEETIYHPIWSNQCIELWFLLHFCYFQSDLHRSAYMEKLTRYMTDYGYGAYEKNRPDIFQTLRPHMEYAVANARRLEEKNQGRTPAAAAPGTQVYRLIETLRPYL